MLKFPKARMHSPIRFGGVIGVLSLVSCGSPGPGPAPTADGGESTTTQPAETAADDVARRQRIETMYAEYRAEAFADVPDITVKDLDLVESETPLLLVDCREDHERAVSGISGAISRAEFEADPESFRAHLIVTYCTIGYRSGEYAGALIERDFDAINLQGGVLAWAHEGRPFVASDGGATKRVHVYGPTWDLLPAGYMSVHEGKPAP